MLAMTRREAQRAVEEAEARCVAAVSARFCPATLEQLARHLARCNAALAAAQGKVLVTPSKTSHRVNYGDADRRSAAVLGVAGHPDG